MSIFPQRLTELRMKRKLRQRDLAKFLHLSPSAISNYEQSLRCPDLDILIEIADYFDVSTDYLLGRTNERSEPREKHCQSFR